jgi:hypothetical protein
MRLVMVNTKALWNTNLCAYASGCASPVRGGMIEEGVDKNCKNTVSDYKMFGTIFRSKRCKAG